MLRKSILFMGVCFVVSGLMLTGFITWRYFINNDQIATESIDTSKNFSKDLIAEAKPVLDYDPLNPPVMQSYPPYEQFGNIYVPKFGTDYVRPIAETTDTNKVLDRGFVGHYTGTAFPGGVGNFSIAAHRSTDGSGFKDLVSLVSGDKVYIQTADGYYTYEIYATETVLPTEVRVIYPVPNQEGVQATQRYITLTTCTPLYSDTHRAVAHGLFVEWRPLSAGAPEEIAPYIQR